MNTANVHGITLSLLMVLSAIRVKLSEWQLGFFAIVMLFSLGRWDQRKPPGKTQNRGRRKKVRSAIFAKSHGNPSTAYLFLCEGV